jgi:hypothetical protein
MLSFTLLPLLLAGCWNSDSRKLAKCAELGSTWGIETAKKTEILRSLGVSPGNEQIVLQRVNHHRMVNKENFDLSCLHTINGYEHEK